MVTDGVDGARLRDVLGKRANVLAALADEPLDKPALGETVGVSRSTIDRAIADLEETGLVERSDGQYEATHTGGLALETYREYTDVTDTLSEAEPLLSALPADAPIGREVFQSGTVTYADPSLPEAALSEVLARIPAAETLRGLAPVVKTNYVSMLRDAVEKEGLSVEIIVEAETLDSLESVAAAREEVAEFFAADEVDVLTTEERLPYALWLLEGPEMEHAGITVHEGGAVVGVLSNGREDVVATYRGQYESVREEADPLGVEEFGE